MNRRDSSGLVTEEIVGKVGMTLSAVYKALLRTKEFLVLCIRQHGESVL